jgi:hypothetical protein
MEKSHVTAELCFGPLPPDEHDSVVFLKLFSIECGAYGRHSALQPQIFVDVTSSDGNPCTPSLLGCS